MHIYLQLTRSLAVTLIGLYCNKLVLRYVRLRVSDLGQVLIPQPGIVTILLLDRFRQLSPEKVRPILIMMLFILLYVY